MLTSNAHSGPDRKTAAVIKEPLIKYNPDAKPVATRWQPEGILRVYLALDITRRYDGCVVQILWGVVLNYADLLIGKFEFTQSALISVSMNRLQNFSTASL